MRYGKKGDKNCFALKNYMNLFYKLFLVGFLLGVTNKTHSTNTCYSMFSDSTGGQVFFNYAQRYYKQNGNNLPKGWKEKIALTVWTRGQAIEFLDFLEGRIGQKNTVQKLIHSHSYFHINSYKNFLNRVSFYEAYIGEQAVNKHLNKTLLSFMKGEPKEISLVIKIVKNYLTEEEIKKLMIKNLESFARANPEKLKKKL